MDEGPDDGAAVADGGVGDVLQRDAEQRLHPAYVGRGQHVSVPRERADTYAVDIGAHVVEIGQPVDVDQRGRRRQSHVEQRHQALPAREHLRSRIGREGLQGVPEVLRTDERERCGLQLTPEPDPPGGGPADDRAVVVGMRQRAGDLAGPATPAPVDQVVVHDDQDRPERDAAQREVVRDLEGDATDARDQTGRETHQVDRVAEVDPVLDPDLGTHQTDHAVEDHRDAAEHATGRRADDRAELRAQAEQDRDERRHVVGGRGVDLGGTHDADVLRVGRGGRAAEGAREGRRRTVGEQRSAHVGVEVGLRHLGDRLDVAGVLGDQRDHAGQHQQDEREGEARRVHDRDAVTLQIPAREPDPVRGLHATPADAVVLDLHSVAGRGHRVDFPEDHIDQPREQVAEDQGEEHGDTRPEARKQHRRADHERGNGERDPLVLRPVDPGDDRRQVEPDQHHDGPGDRRGQQRVDHPRARDVHQYADEREDQAGDQDRSGDVGGVAALGADRRHPGDERRAGAEVARHPVRGDQQEQDRADPREQDRQVGVEPHDQGEHERRAEHRDDVLGAEPDRASPRKPLVGCDRLAGGRCHHFPAEHRRHLDPPEGEGDRSGDPHHTPGSPDFAGGTPYTGRHRAAGAAASSR